MTFKETQVIKKPYHILSYFCYFLVLANTMVKMMTEKERERQGNAWIHFLLILVTHQQPEGQECW